MKSSLNIELNIKLMLIKKNRYSLAIPDKCFMFDYNIIAKYFASIIANYSTQNIISTNIHTSLYIDYVAFICQYIENNNRYFIFITRTEVFYFFVTFPLSKYIS